MWLGVLCGVGKVLSWLRLLPDLRPWCWMRMDLLLAQRLVGFQCAGPTVLVPLLHPRSYTSVAVLASDFLILSWSWGGWIFTNTFLF